VTGQTLVAMTLSSAHNVEPPTAESCVDFISLQGARVTVHGAHMNGR